MQFLTGQLIKRNPLGLNFWTIKDVIFLNNKRCYTFFKTFFFLKAYQSPYLKPESNNKEYMQRRRQQQLLTCNKFKLLTCFKLCNNKHFFLKKRIFSVQLLYVTYLFQVWESRSLTCWLLIYTWQHKSKCIYT